MTEVYTVNRRSETPDQKERIRLADMLRGTDLVAGLTTPDVRRAIARVRRREGTAETTRSPRHYTLGSVVAKIAERLIFWEGKGQDERGPHISFAQLEAETGETKRKLQTARKVGEDEGLWTATPGFRPDAPAQRTLFWNVNLWRVHEVVYEGALDEARTKLDGGCKPWEREKLWARVEVLEAALSDLKLGFLDDAETADEDPSGGTQGTTCTQPDNKLARFHGGTQEGLEERVLTSSTPKKPDPRASLGASKITTEEAHGNWVDLIATDPNGELLEGMARNMAEANRTGRVAITRVWRQIGRKYLAARESEGLSDDSWRVGLEAAYYAGSWSIAYAVKPARKYEAAVYGEWGPRSAGTGEDAGEASDLTLTAEDYANPELFVPETGDDVEPEPDEPAPDDDDPVVTEEAAQDAAASSPPPAPRPEPVEKEEPRPRYTYNEDRIAGMRSACAATSGGKVPAEDGGRPEERLHAQLVTMMGDPGTELGGMVERRLQGDEGAAFPLMAQKAEGLLGTGRPPDWLAGAIEYHVDTLRREAA